MRTRLLLLPSLLLVGLGAVPVDAAQKTTGEQRQLELLGGMSREQQLAAPNQLFLQSYVRHGALLYLHRLDGLACSDLYSLGDEVLFAGAFGNTDGSEHNLVFLEGAGSPSHLDSGPYRFPADTWRGLWPLGPDLNTFWHEVNHALLDAAGLGIAEAPYAASLDDPGEGAGMRSRTALTSSDEHHPFIEGVGQRNSEAYGLLFAFEEAVRRADRAESEYLAEGRAIDHSVERQLWSEAHMRFSAFLKAMKRVANMPPEALGAYRQATGVFFSTAEQVAELYRSGGMKRLQRGEALGIRPPAWVFFPDLMRMPVQLVLRDAEGRDLEQPGVASTAKFQIKDGIYRQELRVEVRARGSAARLTRDALKNREIGGFVARGTLRIRVVEDEPLVTLSVRQGGQSSGGVAAPGGPSQQLFDLDLSAKDSQPIRVVFVRRKLPELREPTTYHVELSYADKGKDPIYDTATAQASFALGPGAAAAKPPAAPASTAPAAPPPSTSTPAPARGQPKTGEKLGLTFGWGPLPEGFRGTTGFMSGDQYGPHNPLPTKGECELVTGPVLFFEKGKWGTNGIVVQLFVNRREGGWAMRDHVEELSRDNPMFAKLFEHREGQVGGRRAFVSRMRANGGQKVNWVYSVELDPKRALWANILSDLDVDDKHKDVAPALERGHEQLIATLRFGPDASPLGVSIPVAKPVPKGFTDEPIEEGELLRRPPPPKTEPKRSAKKRSRPVQCASPGGYTLTLPATWARGERAGGAQLFNSNDRRFVLACPDAVLSAPRDFAGFRAALAEQWKSRDGAARVEGRECGSTALLLIATGKPKRPVWHLYAGRGSKAVELRVLGVEGTREPPGDLFEAACRIQGLGTP